MASELGVQTIQHTNGTDALVIGSDGVVTQPNPVAFFTKMTNAQTGLAADTNVIMKCDTVDIDTHSAYSTSTGEFTVPVAGYYQFNAYINPDMSSGTANRFFTYFIVNGTTRYQTAHTPTPYQSDRMGISSAITLNLSQNDTVAVLVYVNGGTSYVLNGYSVNAPYTDYYNYFSGQLLA